MTCGTARIYIFSRIEQKFAHQVACASVKRRRDANKVLKTRCWLFIFMQMCVQLVLRAKYYTSKNSLKLGDEFSPLQLFFTALALCV